MTPKDNATATLAPPRVFADVGSLLADPMQWSDWLRRHPDRAPLFADTYAAVVRLQDQTAWPVDVLLEQLGCDAKTEEALLDLDDERLRECHTYMRWVETLLPHVETQRDIRTVIGGAARFYLTAHRDVAEATRAMGIGEFPAFDYLDIGEVNRAWEVAAMHIDPAPEPRDGALADNPFAEVPTTHIGTHRLSLLWLNAEELGEKTRRFMRDHLEDCPACSSAYQRVNPSRAAAHRSDPLPRKAA